MHTHTHMHTHTSSWTLRCTGLVLLNSAGLLVKGYVPPDDPPAASPPPRFVANAVSQVCGWVGDESVDLADVCVRGCRCMGGK